MSRIFLMTLTVYLLLATWLPSRPALQEAASPAPGDAFIVGLAPGFGFDDSDLPIPRLATSRLFGPFASSIQPLGAATYRLLLSDAGDASSLARLRNDARVRFVEPDTTLTSFALVEPARATVSPDDSFWPEQDEMRLIEADRSWRLTTGSSEVIIAILDTGVDDRHVDLVGNVLPGYDFVAGREGADDDEGHGTFTAALAAGRGQNRAGIAGVCWQCRVLPLKILNQHGRGSVSAFSQAIRYAVDHGARVINVSAGSPTRSQAMEEAVEYARKKGVLIVAAVGNSADERPSYPAALEPVLAVAASGGEDKPTEFSTFGSFVDLAAPGMGITSALKGSGDLVTRADGSSASAALVSGAAGLLLSLRPELSAEELANHLLDTTLDIGQPGRDNVFGTGRLAVYDAALTTLPPNATGDIEVLVTRDAHQEQRLSAAGFTPGELLRVWSSAPGAHNAVLRGIVADTQGAIMLNLAQMPGLASGPQVLTLVGDSSLRVASVAVTLATPPIQAYFERRSPPPDGDDRLYFAETGHTLGGRFRHFWEANGGLAIFGYPISEEFREISTTDGRTYVVQYFERNRFEFHPEHAGTPHEVQLGLLGSLATRGRIFPPATALPSDGLYFPATQHTLTGEFRLYWEANGGLAVFGYPISEPQIEGGLLVQYFERNRFEYHPEFAPAYRVSLGLLGADLAQRNGYLNRP